MHTRQTLGIHGTAIRRYVFLWMLLDLIVATQLHALSGRLHDLQGRAISNTPLTFVMEQDSSVKMKLVSDAAGEWTLPDAVGLAAGQRLRTRLLAPPSLSFSSGVRVPFYTSGSGEITWEILDLRGRRLAHATQKTHAEQEGILSWDGRSNLGNSIPSGIYLLRISGTAGNAVVRLFKTSGTSAAPSGIAPTARAQLRAQRAVWNQGVTWTVRVDKQGYEPLRLSGISTDTSRLALALCPALPVPYAVTGKYLGRRNPSGGVDPLFLRGVNLGVSVPGTQPGEMAATRLQIRRWLERIGAAGFDCIRTYTLHFPHFYEELAAYNNAHWQKPLYLFQGVWLDEEIPADLYASTRLFKEAIREIVDCSHGQCDIEPRFGRAYGRYRANVSPWTMGWIVGREVYPDQVLTTDSLNPDRTRYAGQFLSMPQGSPTETWFTEALDGMIAYEQETYGSQRPVSVSSWPTLDPLSHPTEVDPSQEDDAQFDMNEVDISKAPGGYFASYHAYPYYPDFMSAEQGFQSAKDSTGPNSYLGYLRAMRSHYDRIPLVVAEFGVPSSWGNAHWAQSTMHHGGHDEATQGAFNVRQLENIHTTGCAGGFVFAWIDEWFKKAWITEPMSSTSERRHLWHDLTNPEQNFGLVSFDVPDPDWSAQPRSESTCGLSVRTATDHAFFHMRVTAGADWKPGDTLELALDTYDADKGESLLPSGTSATNRPEFCLRLEGDSARLLVTRAYNLFGIWHRVAPAEALFHSTPTTGTPWDLVRWKNNRGETDIFEIGRLRVRKPGAPATSLDAVTLRGDTVDVRIPWTLLQFTDPSRMEVMDDLRSTAGRETATSDGIAVTAIRSGCKVQAPRTVWNTWDVAPETTEREKPSLKLLENAFKTRSWPTLP